MGEFSQLHPLPNRSIFPPMGVCIHAIADPNHISRTAWSRVYDETLTILRKWPDPPIRPRHRKIAGTEIIVYSRDVIDADGWHICGDARSRLTAESIELPRRFGVAKPRKPRSDLALRVLASQESSYDGDGDDDLCWLLNNKTQNKPFHSLVLAVAMLLEHRLPHAVLAGGDFSREQAQEAQSRLEAILGETIPLPVAADLPRLRDRLKPHRHGAALRKAVEILSCQGTVAAVLISALRGSLGSRPHQEIEEAVSCTKVSTLDPLTREAFEVMIGQSKALFGRRVRGAPRKQREFPKELLALDAKGLLEIIASGTNSTYLCLTEMAWDDIQRASLPELRLLALLAPQPTSGLIAHQLRLAVFESVAIRRFCLKAWKTTAPVNPREMPIQARFFDESLG